ncbi:hypothetical protein [uncultured Sulfitobacter sp.]|uniref:hypothetical protein n=1 Tax=uncultured Sulfitobacter sp. TaxID=191468 RepID=UPI002633DB0A|nr:hypothetical protein [uncultured Sulfitobacter sp.]
MDPSQKDAEVAAPRPRKARNLPLLADPGADDLATKPRKAFAVRNSGAAPRRRDGALGRLSDRMRASLASYRFRPWYAVLAGFALLIVFRPWLMLGVAFVGLFMGIGVYLILGYDGFWRGVIRGSRWYARRNPLRAKIIHQRLDGFAMRWDAVLDRFPEGTVDGLYLPDVSELATADARHDQAMERRLARLRENEA